MPSPVAELLARLGRAFDSLGADWYLFGAQAAMLHGVSRVTADLDVTVRLGPTTPAELVAALEDEGLASRVADAPEFIEQARVAPVVDLKTGVPVDVVLADSGLEDLIFEEMEIHDVDGVRVPAPRVEHLVVLKVLAGRPKDAEDLVAMIAARRDELDRADIEALLAELEEALDRSDLLPLFREALLRARG